MIKDIQLVRTGVKTGCVLETQVSVSCYRGNKGQHRTKECKTTSFVKADLFVRRYEEVVALVSGTDQDFYDDCLTPIHSTECTRKGVFLLHVT